LVLPVTLACLSAASSLSASPHVWRADGHAWNDAVLPTGHPVLNAHLPGGGWPLDGLVEVLQARPERHAWQLVLPALAQVAQAQPGPVVLVGNEIGLGVIPLGHEGRAFVDALGQVAESAKAAGKDQGSAINDYRSRYQDYVLERNLAEAKAASARWQIFAAIGSGLALIALFSLVLVLMAIERNTRNSATHGASS